MNNSVFKEKKQRIYFLNYLLYNYIMSKMDSKEVHVLRSKLKKIGTDSLLLINKYKYEYESRNEDYINLVKINKLAHECYKSLNGYP